jgi:hypothetical protein
MKNPWLVLRRPVLWITCAVVALVVQFGWDWQRAREWGGETVRIITSPPAEVWVVRRTTYGKEELPAGPTHQPLKQLASGGGDFYVVQLNGYKPLPLSRQEVGTGPRYPLQGSLALQPLHPWTPLLRVPGYWLAGAFLGTGLAARRASRRHRDAGDLLVQRFLDNDVGAGLPIGPYKVVGLLGRGGMAAVYEVVPDGAPGERRALKLLNANTSVEAQQRYEREVKLSVSLQHRNLVAFYDHGEFCGRYYLVMEKVTGSTLDVAWHGVSLPTRLRWLAQAAEGVAALHGRGILHRDLKPSNLMLAGDKVVVMDFGIARALEGPEITAAGQVAGTPGYMAPEQVRGETVSQGTDLYALGVTIYAACAERLPFRGETAAELLARQATEAPVGLEQVRPDLPDEFCAWVMRLLANEPAERPGAAADVSRQLLLWADRLEAR